MILKQFFLLLFVLLLINGCSSIPAPYQKDSIQKNTSQKPLNDRDYISDTEIELSPGTHAQATLEYDPVMESTYIALQSSPAIVNFNIQEKINEYKENKNKVPEIDIIWERLPELFQFSDINHKRVQSQQQVFLKQKRNIEKISKRASPFLYLIIEEIEKQKLPGEIALLPFIESAFRTHAYSGKKASGLWQFVPATGRHFGLKQTWWYDGRRDVYKSTNAALAYLKQLNKYYKGDWMLALAAYNAGTGNINRAVRKNRKNGKPIDYWSLDLTKETQDYVPKLLAIAKLIQRAKDYNIRLSPIDNRPRLILVNIQSQISLSMVAKMADISLKELKTYNPAFNQWATDPDGPHHLLIPINKVDRFEQKLALLDENDHVQWHRHKIRSGESLSVIAHKYKLSIQALMHANHLKNSRIRAGKYLMLPIASAENTHMTDTATIINTSPSRKTPVSKTLSNKPVSKKTREISYKVQRGDSLYVISKRFKVSINELKNWNGISTQKYIKPGQKLKVIITQASQAI